MEKLQWNIQPVTDQDMVLENGNNGKYVHWSNDYYFTGLKTYI